MDKREFVSRAADSDAFLSSDTSAGYINPTIWDRKVFDHVKANLVVANLGEYLDHTGEGATYNVTVDVEPATAGTVAEAADVAITAMTFTQVQFTPYEWGVAYQLTDKEARRSFFDVMENMVKKLGYRLALGKDNRCVLIATAGAGNAITANGELTASIDSGDTLDYADMINAKVALAADKHSAYAMVAHPYQIGSLLKDTTYTAVASTMGDVIKKSGLITVLAGMEVYESQNLTITGTVNLCKALVFGHNGAGSKPFAVCQKALPTIKTQYFARGRYTDIVAVEEYDVKVLYANGICTIQTWAAE